jgi:predicted permease
VFRRSTLEREMDDEVQSHLEHRAEDLVRAGHSPAEADRLARLEFGPVAARKDDMRVAVGLRLVDELHADVRQTLRKLRRSPSFALTTILVLAVGIGATSAIFSVIYGVLIQPLPYPQPQRLIALTHRSERSGQDRLPASTALYFTYRDHNGTFEAVSLWTMDTATITGVGSPEEVRALDTTFELLPMLGVRPQTGRVFTSTDDQAGSARTVILTDGYWQRRFGASQVLGRRLTVDGVPHEIIGVLPRSFRFLRQDVDVVLPLQPNRARSFVGPLGENGIARLRPNATIEDASRDIERMMPILLSSFPPVPGTNPRPQGLRPNLRYLQDAVVGDLRDVLWVMMGTIAMLLVIACANVGNLQLVHAEGRHHEFTVQAALGASRWRIARGMLAENVLMALIAGALGLGLASVALPALLHIATGQLPGALEVRIGWPVIGFAVAVSIISGLLFGTAAAVRHTRPAISVALGTAGRSVSASRESQRIRSGLLVAQVALALVLLVAAGLMLRTFQAVRSVNLGFDPSPKVLTVDISLPGGPTPDFNTVIRKFHDIQDRLSAISGVDVVGFASRVPLGRTGPSGGFIIEHVTPVGVAPAQREFRFVSPDFFKTIGTPLIAGRDFTWADHHESRRVALISEGMARREWGSAAAAIGKRIRMTTAEPWREVVGVLRDVHHESLVDPPPDSVYLTLGEGLAQFMSRAVTFVVRSSRVGSQDFVKELQTAVWSVDGTVPLANVQTLADYYRRAMDRTTLTLMLLGVTSGMALLLGLVGIYAVVSHLVSTRLREIGIRLALGAQTGALRRMLVGRVLVLVLVGLAIGLLASTVLASVMETLVFGVTPRDAATYLQVSVLLGVAAVCAGYLPALRITRIDPTSALRSQ